ncbi:MAG: phycobiliprotein lyase [Cyanobacteria bacterium RM1_2_2]|nr:phycobiliprotein lyase [Cyanobacteria bacterium RM1_2_2]
MIQAVQSLDALVEVYFQLSEGKWHSQRRYYTLKEGETQEVVSDLTVIFLPRGSEELIHLARLHQLEDETALTSGALTTWESNYIGPSPKTLSGSTLFGVRGNLLYRDRGFSTAKPVTAEYHLRDPKTMCLKTEYGGNCFEEEVKLIGTNYRTRQTIISRAGEEQMIGQYLETRVQ